MPWSLENVLPCRQQLELESRLNALAVLDEASGLAREIDNFLRGLAARDLSGRLMTRLISAFNDRLTIRIIELTARRHRMPRVSWCWLALGSEGRHEQTFVSDQDNGLVFSATNRESGMSAASSSAARSGCRWSSSGGLRERRGRPGSRRKRRRS